MEMADRNNNILVTRLRIRHVCLCGTTMEREWATKTEREVDTKRKRERALENKAKVRSEIKSRVGGMCGCVWV